MLLAFGLFNYLGGSPAMESTFGTPVYPVTALMMEYMQGSYQFLLVDHRRVLRRRCAVA